VLVVLHLNMLSLREVRTLRVLNLLIRLSKVAVHGDIRCIPLSWFRPLRIGEARRYGFTACIVLLL